MPNQEFVLAENFCTYHNVQYEFIQSLQDSGLIEINFDEQRPAIAVDQLPALEKMVRMHAELEINSAGIETIFNLLERMEELHKEMTLLKSRLSKYEHS